MASSRWPGEGLSSQGLLTNDNELQFPQSVSSESLVNKGVPARRWISWASFHVTLICLYSVIFLGLLFYGPQSSAISKADLLPLPAREALKPQFRRFPTELDQNAFAGDPRPELEQAWHSLLQNDNIHVPREALNQLQLNSVYTQDGSEGIASLSVYHSLHCLKLVRKMMYKEHYHANISGTAMDRQKKHADHCVEYLRETLMCKPDISLVTFRWINDTAQHPDEPAAYYPTNFDSSLHECADWDSLDRWAGARAFDLYDVDSLDRPEA